jgi:hypothetical protein
LSLFDEIIGCQNNLAPIKAAFNDANMQSDSIVIKLCFFITKSGQMVRWSVCVYQFDQGMGTLEFS